MRQRAQRKRRLDSQESRDRWMITYADLITLLLIFFVILYAMSSLDTDKYKIVTGSLSESFKSGSSVLEGSNGVLDAGQVKQNNEATNNSSVEGISSDDATSENKSNGENGNTTEGYNNVEDAEEIEDTPPSARELAFREQEVKLADLMGVITKYVEDNQLGEQIFISDKPQGIEITLSDRFLFDVGKADLKSPAFPALRQLSDLFGDIGASISIEGHTDNTPVTAASRYNDNWELSGARALSVLRFFLDNEGLQAGNFQYAGYADTRPAADNTTSVGQQKNRRVEIIVLRQLQEAE